MNIEDRDDPRARELHKAAHKLAELVHRQLEHMPSENIFDDAWYEHDALLQSQILAAHERYKTLLKELGKEETRITGGWRNEGE